MAAAIIAVPLIGCSRPAPDKTRLSKRDGEISAAAPHKLVELTRLDPSIRLDIRYATPDNIAGRMLYSEARAFLARPAAEALVRVHAAARTQGYGLTIFDAYRPWRVTKALWDATPPGPRRHYVANPREGSKHNRGCAVDLSLHDVATGRLVPMPSDYDDLSPRAHRDYSGSSDEARSNRALLERLMAAEGFAGLPHEWWHFDFAGWRDYPILDVPFEEIGQ